MGPGTSLSTTMMSGVVWSVLCLFPTTAVAVNILQIAYHLQSWRNAFAMTTINVVKAQIEEEDELTPPKIAEAMEVYLTPAGIPPTYSYFWHEWEIQDDGTVKKSVCNLCHDSFCFGNSLTYHSKGSLPEFGSHRHICSCSYHRV